MPLGFRAEDASLGGLGFRAEGASLSDLGVRVEDASLGGLGFRAEDASLSGLGSLPFLPVFIFQGTSFFILFLIFDNVYIVEQGETIVSKSPSLLLPPVSG